MVENYTKDLKESIYHGAIGSVLAIGYTMLGKTLIKMSPPSLSKFDVEDGVKLVAIVAMSDFTKDYLVKQKIIPNNIYGMASVGFLIDGALINALDLVAVIFSSVVYLKNQLIKNEKDMTKHLKICNELK